MEQKLWYKGHGSIPGRGTAMNPTGRFEKLALDLEGFEDEPGQAAPETRYLKDSSRSILSSNDSPDVGFRFSANPYRGCEHGCAYCYARPTHEYLGLSAGLDFESVIMVKTAAPALLRRELSRPGYRCEPILFSGVTDCYQRAERALKLTRGCLEVLLECRHPVGLITKSALVTRDLDLLSGLAALGCATVCLTVTTLDASLSALLEPRAAPPQARLSAIRTLARAGVPVGVNVAPVIPGLTDHEIPSILQAARDAGARGAGAVMLRLPYGVKDLFSDWLGQHFPDRKDKVLGLIRAVRDGALNEASFGSRMRGQGPYADQIWRLFEAARRKAGFPEGWPGLSTRHFRRPGGQQLDLLPEG